MLSSSLPSRIRESAAGLAKDFLSNSTHAASETTDELATLKSAHKLSSATSSHGTSSSSQLPKNLSNRHRNTSDYLQHSLHSPGLYSSEAHDEFSNFLLQECDIGEASTSSSRSGSTLNLASENEDGSLRWHDSHLRRNDSFEPELSRAKQKSPAQSVYTDVESSQEGYYRDTSLPGHYDQVEHFEQCFTKASRDEQHSDGSVSVKNIRNAEAAQRKQRALSRLQLILSQMPVVRQVERQAALDQSNAFESSYNQLCGGEDAQEWAEFEASLFHAHSIQDSNQDHAQMQQKQEEFTATRRQASLQESRLMQKPQQPQRTTQHVRNEAPKENQDQTKHKEPLPEFHCPWIDCHSRFRMCADYIRDTDNPDSLPCVHSGCELEFATEEVWRKHVSIAHHNLLPRLQQVEAATMEAAWEKVQT